MQHCEIFTWYRVRSVLVRNAWRWHVAVACYFGHWTPQTTRFIRFPWPSERLAKFQRFVYRNRVALLGITGADGGEFQGEFGRVKPRSAIGFFQSGLSGDYFTSCRRLHVDETTFGRFLERPRLDRIFSRSLAGTVVRFGSRLPAANSKNPKGAGWPMGRDGNDPKYLHRGGSRKEIPKKSNKFLWQIEARVILGNRLQKYP